MIPRIVIEDIVRNQPFVSVIIPTKNNFDLVKQNLESWKRNVTYQEYQILIVDTGSYPSIIQKYESILTPQIRLIRYDYYNFGRINNDVVLNHLDERTELLLFCNDDIVLMNDALTRMVSIYNNRTTSVGTIGCRLHYPNEKIQHNGIFVTRDGKLGHMDYMKSNGYRMDTNYNAIGNTGAFMLTSLELFNKIFGTTHANTDDLHKYMRANKTDCALKVFDTTETVNFPQYILDAIT